MVDPQHLRLPDGRILAFDDVGDPAGVPVVYLHGTPDSRLARHPDDGLAARCGVRLLAVDRPGSGASDAHPGGTLTSVGHDLVALLDDLGLDAVGLLGWSTGGLFALAATTVLGPRVGAVSLVGTVPPVEAYADPSVVAALSPARRSFVEALGELGAAELGRELAPYLIPEPLTPSVALEHVLESAGEAGRADLAAVPGAVEQLARALQMAGRGGPEALAHDIARQVEPGLDLSGWRGPVRSLHGTLDPVSPPAVGEWLAGRVPQLVVEVVPDAGHHLLFPWWEAILTTLVRDMGSRGGGPIGC